MKNLNVELAKNFKVEIENVNVNCNFPKEGEDDHYKIMSYVEKFLTKLAKKKYFPRE